MAKCRGKGKDVDFYKITACNYTECQFVSKIVFNRNKVDFSLLLTLLSSNYVLHSLEGLLILPDNYIL